MNKFHLISLAAAALVACSENPDSKKLADAPDSREENIVVLTKQNLAHVQIQSATVVPGRFETALNAAGRVSENMNKTAKVASTLEGRLLKLNFDINDRVKTGDVLALVQAPELLGKALEIKAPIDGAIISRNKAVGELVDKSTDIYNISDPTDLWVTAEIKERDVAAVKVGQDAAFRVLAYPDEEFRGKVVRLGNQIEAGSRTLEVRIEANNNEGKLKPGMFADVEITTTVLNDVIVVADSTLQSDGDRPVAFIALGDNKFEKRALKLGLKHHGRNQVLEGIKPGEQIVTEGSFILKSELRKGELAEE